MNRVGVLAGHGFAQADNTIAGGDPIIVVEEQFQTIRRALPRNSPDERPVGASVGQNQFATLAFYSCVYS